MQPMTSAGALVGRTAELAVLAARVKQLTRRRGGSVLVEGEPGIGKSSLVRAAVAAAPELGCQVFWGAGDELAQPLPLLPFLEGLRVREASVNPRRNAIVELLRGGIAIDRSMDVLAILTEQLLALVTEQCTVRPTVLVIDDLQWADQASITLWGRLARLTSQVPLLLVGMLRPVPQRDDVLALRRVVGDADRLQLTGLSEAAAAELVTALVAGRPDGGVLQLADGAAGNPLYLTELVAALTRGAGLTVTQAGIAELAGGLVPDSLSAAIRARLDFVTSPVRDALRAAALLGTDFAVGDLSIVLGRSVADLVPSVVEACAAGVLVESDRGGLGFRHPLIREALYDEMPPSLRAAWHREAGRALAKAGVAADRVARQMLRVVDDPASSVEPMDGWMLKWLAGAADPLVRQAPGVAAELLCWARASSPAGSAQHCWLASRLAEALYRTGDYAAAERVADQALQEVTEPDVRVDLHWTLAQCRLLAGDSAESLATLDQALASPGISAGHRARLLILAARTRSSRGELQTAHRAAAGALEAASEAADNWATGWALLMMAALNSSQGRMTDSLPLFDRALAVTEADPALSDLQLLLEINKAVVLGDLDQLEQALATAASARRRADQVGTTVRMAQANSTFGELLFIAGRWDEAMAEMDLLPENLKTPTVACCCLGIAAIICFHRGEADAARRYLAAAGPHAERIGHRLIGPLTLARSLDREQDGALPEALATLTDALADNAGELEDGDDLLADAVRLAAETGDLDTARALADQAATLAAGPEIPHRQANALYCRGLLDHDTPQLLAAAEHYDDAGRPLLAAKALEAAAGQFIDDGDHGQARAAFTDAAEVYTSLNATSDIDRLQAKFRAHGIRRGPHVRHRRAQSGWDSLTPAEVRIAELVGQGLTNPEIAAQLQLSPRTVGTHVSSTLKKLGVHSRIDIATLGARRSIA